MLFNYWGRQGEGVPFVSNKKGTLCAGTTVLYLHILILTKHSEEISDTGNVSLA